MTQEDIERLKGQAKEKVGDATQDPELAQEGKNEQASADIKDGVNKVADKVTDAVDAIKDKLNKNK